MSDVKGVIGGFAATNTGEIEDCYCLTRLRGKKYLSGGFIGENKGRISTSFCEFGNKGLTGGFTGSGSSQCKNSFFFHDLNEDSKKLEDLIDIERGKRISFIKSDKEAAEFGFDTEKIWTYTGESPLLKFQDANWIYPIQFNPKEDVIIKISSADDLFTFAEKVNQGNHKYMKAKVVLTSDIDLHGKTWTPIGDNNGPCFEGVFNGNGYTIENFVIKDKRLSYLGFFGLLKGEVYNLSVDCILKGNGCLGGIAAVNAGTIGCCSAIVDLKGKGKNLKVGGLVGINKGHIFQSYAAGSIRFPIIPLLPLLILLGIIALILVIIFILKNRPGIYNAVPSAPGQIKIDNLEPMQGTNHMSFQFEENVEIDLASGDCTLNFQNPGDSNHRIVVQLQMTDTTAIEAMGSTGRSASEQKEIEAKGGYDPDNERVVIAESGAIDPGYQLNSLTLTDFAQDNLKPGDYQAIIFLVPYSIENNGKAMLQTQLPVLIHVQ